MNGRKTVLIICSQDYNRQPRVLNTIEALKEHYEIIVAGSSDLKNERIKFIDLSDNLKKNKIPIHWHFNKPAYIRLPVSFYQKFVKQKRFYKPFYYEQQYWTAAKQEDFRVLSKHKFDLIISHGVDTLPLSVKLSQNTLPVIFNAHEYYPLEFEQDDKWLRTEGKMIDYIIKRYLPKCDFMFCVSENIQAEYQKNCKIRSIPITNAPPYLSINIKKTEEPIRIIHHGAAMRARKLELMADMMAYLGTGYMLYFMLVPTEKDYIEELKEKYKNDTRINFVDPVPVNKISIECNKYDIGLFILPPVNFNWLNALPNKIFEYVQARLAIAVSPNPDMKRLVEVNDLGIVSADYSAQSMAKALMSLTKEMVDGFKANSNTHAKELSAENNKKKILQTVETLLKN